MSDAGDVNGDGFADLIIGAPGAPNSSNSGASYVVFGKAGGFVANMNLNLSTLNGSNGFAISGVAAGDASGFSVSTAGDFNGDGFDDIVIGASGAEPNGSGSGASYVVFGKASGFAPLLSLSTLDGSNGFKISGVAAGDGLGRSVSAAGDVNGDGFGDLIIGAPLADFNGTETGASYVVFGKATVLGPNLNVSTLDGSNGFKLSGGGTQRGYSGFSVSAAGDVNGDGFDDLIIGEPGPLREAYAFRGNSYVVFGKASGFAANLLLSVFTVTTLSGVAAKANTGHSVSAAGDVNGDGFDDLIIGAPGTQDNFGSFTSESYVVFGKPAWSGADLSRLDGSNGFKLTGGRYDHAGWSVSAAGDFNGDGFADLIVGAYHFALSGQSTGESYLVFGKASGFAPALSLSTLNGGNGSIIRGAGGYAVSAAGDVNGDGFSDVIIGTSGADGGTSYVVFGSAHGPPAVVSIGDATVFEPVSGTAMASFSVTLSAASAEPVTVEYATADGTAVSPGDYIAATRSTLTFAPGETSKTALVTINADSLSEPDETFSVNLINPTNATLGRAQATGTIRDDGARFISIEDVSVREGNSGSVQAVLHVNLSRPSSSQTVTVHYATVQGSATAVADFTPVSGVLTFIPGEISKTVTVDVQADTAAEGGETFYVNLDTPTNATLVDSQGLVFIVDDDLSNPAVFELGAIDGSNGFRISGVAVGDISGVSVSEAGDVNGDGFGDLIIGASGADPNGDSSGASYVIFGKGSGFATNLNLSALDGSNGFEISGVAVGDRSGGSVSAAGDVNGDGFGDLIIGAVYASPNGFASGASYVVFGKATPFAANLDLSTLDGSNGFELSGAAGDRSGISVSAAGDVNGDGFDDVIIGAFHFIDSIKGTSAGASYLVFGKASGFAASLNLSTLDGSNGFKLDDSAGEAGYLGRAVSAAGDINGDGFGDLILGASNTSFFGVPRAGASYVVFGKASGFAATLYVPGLNGSNGFRLSGAAAYDFAGQSVGAAGDVNGDGFSDVIIGAAGGKNYVVFGKASGFATDVNLSTLDGSNGFSINAAVADHGPVSGVGDVNGDGFDDVIIGASGANSRPRGELCGLW